MSTQPVSPATLQNNGEQPRSQPVYKKNILITGGAGFIGSHVTTHMVNKYPTYNFIILDNLSYCANLQNLASIKKKNNYQFIQGNIQSTDLIRYILQKYSINIIMHFAAETHVDHSFGHSLDFTQTNVLGTHTLLECAKERMQSLPTNESKKNADGNNFDLFLYVSTDEVYGQSKLNDDISQAKTEKDLLNPTNPYSASKAAAEMLVMSYYHSFHLPFIITRSSNVYGPRQFPEKMIPKFIHLISDGKPVCLYGNGANIRTYIHASDEANAFDLILHKGSIGEIYNISSDVEKSNLECAHIMLNCFGIKESLHSKYIEFVKDRVFNDKRYLICDRKLRENIGWYPKISFESGLKDTIKWYLSHSCEYWHNLDDVLVPHPTMHAKDNSRYAIVLNTSEEENNSEVNEIEIENPSIISVEDGSNVMKTQ